MIKHQSGDRPGAKEWLTLSLYIVLILAPVSSVAEVRIIAHPSVPLNSIRKAEVAKIFLGKTIFWNNGDKIIPVILRSGAAHEIFLKQYLEKTPSQFSMYWKQIVFTGKGVELKSFDTESDLVKFVSETQDAVGYADDSSVSSNVKFLSVE